MVVPEVTFPVSVTVVLFPVTTLASASSSLLYVWILGLIHSVGRASGSSVTAIPVVTSLGSREGLVEFCIRIVRSCTVAVAGSSGSVVKKRSGC